MRLFFMRPLETIFMRAFCIPILPRESVKSIVSTEMFTLDEIVN